MSDDQTPRPLADDTISRRGAADTPEARRILRCAGALILDDDGRIFVQRRAPDLSLFPGAWDIVGGHLEPGESTMDALGREIAEETGWRLTDVIAPLPPVTYLGEDGYRRIEEDFLARVAGDLRCPRLEEGTHTEFRWIGPDDVESLIGLPAGTGDELARAILTAGFRLARDMGL